MNRKEATNLLTKILISDKLSDRKYYAKEVCIDYGTSDVKRVDVMQFLPAGVVHLSDIEKGIFICYEIKSCRQDIYSGNGLNFLGERNYIVTTMETYKKIMEDSRNGVLDKYISEHYPESSLNFGFLVPVPCHIDLRNTSDIYKEFENPTPFGGDPDDWKLWSAIQCKEGSRMRSTTELLFCMLRAKHSNGVED